MTQIVAGILVLLVASPFAALIVRSYKNQKQKSPEQRRKDGKKAIIALFALFVFTKIIDALDHYTNHLAQVEHLESTQKLDAAAAQVAGEIIADGDNEALDALKNCAFKNALQFDDGITDIKEIRNTSILSCAQHMLDVKNRANHLGHLSNGQSLDDVQQSIERETDLLLVNKREGERLHK